MSSIDEFVQSITQICGDDIEQQDIDPRHTENATFYIGRDANEKVEQELENFAEELFSVFLELEDALYDLPVSLKAREVINELADRAALRDRKASEEAAIKAAEKPGAQSEVHQADEYFKTKQELEEQ